MEKGRGVMGQLRSNDERRGEGWTLWILTQEDRLPIMSSMTESILGLVEKALEVRKWGKHDTGGQKKHCGAHVKGKWAVPRHNSSMPESTGSNTSLFSFRK